MIENQCYYAKVTIYLQTKTPTFAKIYILTFNYWLKLASIIDTGGEL